MSPSTTRSLPRIGDGIDEAHVRALPEGFCRTFRVIAYRGVDDAVLVAAVNVEDPIAAGAVADVLGEPAVLVPHTAHEILGLINTIYPGFDASQESSDARRARVQLTRLLTDNGLVTHDQARQALVEHSRTGDPIGDILVSHQALEEDVLVAALSHLYQLPRVVVDGFDPPNEVTHRLPEGLARRLQAMPVGEADGVVQLAVARPLLPADAADVADALGQRFTQLLAHRSDLDQLIQRVHNSHYARVSTHFVMENYPERSAHVVLTTAQKVAFTVAALAIVSCAVVWPMAAALTLVALCSALYFCVAAYKFRLTARALGGHVDLVAPHDLASLEERTLPMYSILVPLYREAAMVPRVVAGINALDYPHTRLDVKLLCEEDDLETIEAIEALDLPPHFHLVVVPDTSPKTKPKACNYGLQLATGKYCVIFDAEDRPEPDQLKKALLAFEQVPENVVCLQAKLQFFNQSQNVLTAWFANEYATQFQLMLPAMGAAGSPIPLGGTSNHFKTSALRELGAWDPFNVTEDAELGIQLHREGYRTEMLDSTTWEEATSRLGNWVRQRSRWNKGYFQTWLVHMRHPLQLLRQTGLKGFLSFNLTMGGAAVLLINPVFWALTTVYALTQWHVIEAMYPSEIFYPAIALLVVGNFVFIYLNVAGSAQRGEFGLIRVALISPIYWVLMSYGAWRGFLQLITNPFYWEKTEHGQDQVVA